MLRAERSLVTVAVWRYLVASGVQPSSCFLAAGFVCCSLALSALCNVYKGFKGTGLKNNQWDQDVENLRGH